MEKDKDVKEIMQVTKSLVASSGLTQARVANLLQVSVPTVKRWLSGEGVSLSILLKILKLAGYSLNDLSLMLSSTGNKVFEYSLAQEEFFAENPQHLAFFDQLLLGKLPKQIMQNYRISYRSLRRYLKDLENLNLLSIQPRDKVKLNVEGAPKWRQNGPLKATLGRQAVNEFIGKYWDTGEVNFYFHRYTDEDRSRIEALLSDLQSLARQAHKRSMIDKSKDRGYGLLFALRPFSLTGLKRIEDL